MTLQPNGPRCNCGNTGCLESLASGTAIARQAQDLVAAGALTCIADLVDGDMQRITAKVVHQAAEKGDVVAVDLFRKAGKYLGLGLVNLMYLFNPGLVAIGGGVTKAGDLLLVPMRATFQDRINQVFWRKCAIVAPALGEDVCLMGAAILASDGLSAEE
jgi:glucokinase